MSTTPIASNVSELIGHTDLVRINSLSEISGCNILLKCEHQNPGGSIKDRAALQLITDAIESGKLKPGMTVVEGTAGNTGIGLALVAKSLGYKMLVVMPRGQAQEKERMISLHGAELLLVDPCPFANQNHFYHTAKRLGAENEDYWWADQFENLSNYRAHYLHTGPEIWQQTQGNIDALVSVVGTGGTIAGNSHYLSTKQPNLKTWLVDPEGSGIYSFLKNGSYQSTGSSFTEGIGIMRTVENFRQAKINHAITLPDQDLVTISRLVAELDGILLGSSSSLNVAGALYTAARMGKGNTIVTFSCDLAERSYSKLHNEDFLKERGIEVNREDLAQLWSRYQADDDSKVVNV
ncbi:cysteine synthase [Vibrio breoganii]|uniref:cysteine synthase A n=1 Tax=Vibrio breoganii TaxID=553239 RepID=UPI0002EA69E6|nr:cysteine synthase A [Vibrio breoganii]OCH76271.1 cysteine synthase [Vibrio breoganii]OED85347.1 cysteine synthase [Vibrio breoganii ZF-55]OEF88107.1 cysteine synthase [Vibrio breoganii 1C10]PMK38973.1 cysteine synthase [Vibrio breoganii]PML21611.1 cysteine synthase [Vibrio breoganii]